MINEALKHFRKLHGYKSVEMAEALGISQSYLSELENGAKNKKPSLELIEKYAEIFNTKPSVILFFSEEMDEDKPANSLNKLLKKKLVKIIGAIEKNT